MHSVDTVTAGHKKRVICFVPLGTPANPWESAIFVAHIQGIGRNHPNNREKRKRGTCVGNRNQTIRIRSYPDHITLMVPYNFEAAARAAAHRNAMPVTEYCRRALLLRLEADGVRLGDYDHATAA